MSLHKTFILYKIISTKIKKIYKKSSLLWTRILANTTTNRQIPSRLSKRFHLSLFHLPLIQITKIKRKLSNANHPRTKGLPLIASQKKKRNPRTTLLKRERGIYYHFSWPDRANRRDETSNGGASKKKKKKKEREEKKKREAALETGKERRDGNTGRETRNETRK